METINYKTINDLSVEEARIVLQMDGPKSTVFMEGDKVNFGYKAVWFEYYWISLTFLISDGDFLYILLYFVQSM